MKVTILGSGTSIGVPQPLCECEVCQSKDPHDDRMRCSALVETDEGQNILIDCGPDFRTQALRAKIKHIEALLLTHNHFDHCYGIDDMRAWAFMKPVPTYADQGMTKSLIERWDYIFVHKYPGVPKLELHTVKPEDDDTFMVGETHCQVVRCYHGKLPMVGYRIGSLAYITDCTCIEERDYAKLEGIDTLIIDALRWTTHPTHWCVEESLTAAMRMKPRRIYFTHMSHDMGLHSAFKSRLFHELGDKFPHEFLESVELTYDGMEILINDKIK